MKKYEKCLIWNTPEDAMKIKLIVLDQESIDLFGYACVMNFDSEEIFNLIYKNYRNSLGEKSIPEIRLIENLTEDDYLNKDCRAGTPKARFKYILNELEKRFPNPDIFGMSPPEIYYLNEIDKLLNK